MMMVVRIMLTLVTVEMTLMSRGGVLAELAAQTGEASRERLMEIARAKYFRSDKSYKLIYFSICVSSFQTLLFSCVPSPQQHKRTSGTRKCCCKDVNTCDTASTILNCELTINVKVKKRSNLSLNEIFVQ